MDKRSVFISFFATLIFAFSFQLTNAEEQTAIDCSIDSYPGSEFSALYTLGRKTGEDLCIQLIRSRIDNTLTTNMLTDLYNDLARDLLSNYATEAEKALDSKGLLQSANYSEQFVGLQTTFSNFDIGNPVLPEFILEDGVLSDEAVGYFEPHPNSLSRFTVTDTGLCVSAAANKSCRDLFNDFADAFNPYRSAYDRLYDNTTLLSGMAKNWDEFLEVSKSQTLLEVWFTTLAHRGHFRSDHLVGPPSYQVIALHPQVIYNSMDKAADGNNTEFGLAVEWLGVNFWDLKLPFGFSVASVYADRAEVDDVGHGFLLHFDNRYSIGWADHGDEESVYVTIDLLKLIGDKRSKFDQYMSRF
ncbi:MAG: hypothetical protein CMQ34_02840 [Gammaproteobacteria bacterium]|nr:hypothetical protein [Gammaproteobacteria bacterium]|tara:strand:+ start:5583 stop:6653 length:1071 start_codon:yes stop_codon:yes gene_type:complete